MNKIYTTLAACLVAFGASAARETVSAELPAGAISDINVERSASTLLVSMDVNPSLFTDRSNREVIITPVITNGTDSLELRPVIVAGHKRYWQHKRHDGKDPDYDLLRSGWKAPFHYSQLAEYQEWMEVSTLSVVSRVEGCCGDDLAGPASDDLYAFDFRPKVLEPTYVYVKPMKEIAKVREVEGSAYIDFPVNQTVIYPDYRRNPAELAEIRRTIDEVRDDKDVTITSLHIKGYASPEGSYANNERLAKGRTEALIDYVRKLYSFPKDVMRSSWEAEDWAGLDRRVRELDIENKDAILTLIADTKMAPDAKDQALKRRFPAQYKYLLENVYPALRHSDYKVQYVVRNYTDVAEIARVMKTAPQKLSLDELFLYAKSLDKDSPEFQEVMEVAVRMYPEDPVANLNAATTALAHGETEMARNYLKKSGDGVDAVYTSALLEAAEKNYDKAAELLSKAQSMGHPEAGATIARLRELGLIP